MYLLTHSVIVLLAFFELICLGRVPRKENQSLDLDVIGTGFLQAGCSSYCPASGSRKLKGTESATAKSSNQGKSPIAVIFP